MKLYTPVLIKLMPKHWDEEYFIIPLEPNLSANNVDTFDELKHKFEESDWGYYGEKVEIFLLTELDLPNDIEVFIEGLQPIYNESLMSEINSYNKMQSEDTVSCDEFDSLVLFKDLAYKIELYDTPYSDPRIGYFACYFAKECYWGNVYSKDYNWFECDNCGRNICEQNPSNGYHVQVHYNFRDYDYICNQCFSELIISGGMELDDLDNGIIGTWHGCEDFEKHNWEIVDDIFIRGLHSVECLREKIQKELIDNGFDFLIELCRLGLGGFEGSIALWKRKKVL